jgi:hypothetical protein
VLRAFKASGGSRGSEDFRDFKVFREQQALRVFRA